MPRLSPVCSELFACSPSHASRHERSLTPSYPMPRLSPVCSELRARSPSHASRSTSAASSAPLPLGFTTTPASTTFSSPVLPRLSTGRRLWSFVGSMPSVVASFLSRVIRPSSASPSVSRLLLHVSPELNRTPNHALQRTPGFGVQLPSAALMRPAQSRAVRPAMKPGTARAFALRRRAHSRAPGPESLSLGSFGHLAHAQ